MFQKHAKKILLTLCFALLFMQAPAVTEAKTTDAVQTVEVQETQYASSSTKTPVKYTWKGKKLDSSFFVYRSKLSKQDKKAYDELYANLAAGKKKTTFKTAVEPSKIDKLVQYVIYDNPEFFWVECDFKYTYKNNKVVSVTVKFNTTGSNIKKYKQKFEKAVKPLLKKASKAKTTIEKIKIVHDYLTRTIEYNANARLSQSAYSAIVKKSTVCAGYAKAFSYIMNQLGIRCTYVVGYAGEPHAWNLVQINKKWYNMDVTWDDPVGNPSNQYFYDYFNLSDKQISKDHQRDSISKILPKCTSTKYNYENCKDVFGEDSPVPSGTLSTMQDNSTSTGGTDGYTPTDILSAFYNVPNSISEWTYSNDYSMYLYFDATSSIMFLYEPQTQYFFAATPDNIVYYFDQSSCTFVNIAA